MDIKRIFLVSLIGSLSVSALIGIMIFLVGDFDELQVRVLLTTLMFGLYSLTGLCSATLYEKGRYQTYAAAAIGTSVAAFVLGLISIWGSDPGEGLLKLTLASLVAAVGMAHAALLLRIAPKNPAVRWSLTLTNACIAIVAAMLILLILDTEIGEADSYFRLLGVFAILDVLGTVVTPLLQKFGSAADLPSGDDSV